VGDDDGETTTATAGTRRGVWSADRRTLTTGLVLTITLVGFESLAVATAMPAVRDDLGGLGLYGWVFSAFFLGSLVGIVVSGRAADRHGPAGPFVIGLALFGAGLLAAGAAPSMAFLVAARVVQGLGAGAIPAIAYVSVGRAYPPELRPRVFAVFSTAWVLPGLLGPALSGAVADHLTWRLVFLGLLPLVVLAGAMTVPTLRRFPPVPAGAPRASALPAALAVTAGAGLVLAGIGASDPRAAVALAVPGLVLGIPAFARLVPPGTLRLRAGIAATVATRGILTFAFFGVDAFVSLALTDARGTSTTVAGIALTAATLAWTSAAWVQERTVHRLGPRHLVRLGFLLLAVGDAGMVASLFGAFPLPLAIATWAFAGFGVGLAYSPLSVTVLASAQPGTEGVAAASLQLSDVLGVALGTGATGAAVAIADSLGREPRAALLVAFPVLVGVALLGNLAARRMPRHLPAR
jgi:MFS family permease